MHTHATHNENQWKSLKSRNNKQRIDMFLDPLNFKDYMHVNDYCDAVLTAIKKDLWQDDWNVAAETPVVTGEIINIIRRLTGLELGGVVHWHPFTDYLGNHRLTSEKFKKAANWVPKITLEEGISMSYESIVGAEKYNPLEHLENAKERKIDLTTFY